MTELRNKNQNIKNTNCIPWQLHQIW